MSIEIINPLQGKLSKMVSQQSLDTLCRTIAETMLGEVRDRVFLDGKNATGNQIGTYDNNYIKQRIKKGLGSSSKVILFYEGRLQNDFKVIALGNASYGLGWLDNLNADKANWLQEKYGRIFSLTKEEVASVQTIVNDWINKQL